MSRYAATPATAEGYRRRSKTAFKAVKMKFLIAYGGVCRCCGESNQGFLTIEHILGQVGVKKKRLGKNAYRDALKEYRPDLYEILCYNCNLGKRFTGICPHELEEQR